MHLEIYVLIKNKLVPFQDVSRPLADRDYVEGSLHLSVGKNVVIRAEMIDLIDQLLIYFMNAFQELADGEQRAGFYFPDQPIEVIVERSRNGASLLLLEVKAGAHQASCLVPADDAVKIFCEKTRLFFNHLFTADKKYKAENIHFLNEINKVEIAWAKLGRHSP